MFVRRILPIVLLAVSVVSVAAEQVSYWNVDRLLAARASEISLVNEKGTSFGKISHERLLVLNRVRTRIERTSDVKSDFYLASGDKPNAFATVTDTGKNIFAINLSMLKEIGDDADALAVLMGHELAHIRKNHIRQKMEAAKNAREGGQLASMLLALAGIPGAGVISDLGANAVLNGYSKDQEREADNLGLQFATKAGFDPAGGIRLFRKLSQKRPDKWDPFFSTHPSYAERIQMMEHRTGRRAEKIPASDKRTATCANEASNELSYCPDAAK